jgi:hypothetical protein
MQRSSSERTAADAQSSADTVVSLARLTAAFAPGACAPGASFFGVLSMLDTVAADRLKVTAEISVPAHPLSTSGVMN